MYIVYHSSNLFGMVTGVSIISLLENNKEADSIHILYIEKGLSTENKSKLKYIVDLYGREIEFISMPDWSKKLGLSLKSCKNGWLGFGYNRLFITEIVPETVERVLYLDSDTIIEGSLSALWQLDLDNYYMAGVDDCLSASYKDIVEISGTATYCNAGVLLLNLRKWREDNILSVFIDYITKRKGYFVFNEQTILNSVFSDKILVLPCAYNTNTLVYAFDYKDLMILRKPAHYSYKEEEYMNARVRPIITHYTGCFYINRRPWIMNSDHPHVDQFKKYLDMSPWSENELMSDNRKKGSKLLTLFCRIMPKQIMLRVIGYVYTNVRVHIFAKRIQKERGN